MDVYYIRVCALHVHPKHTFISPMLGARSFERALLWPSPGISKMERYMFEVRGGGWIAHI